MPAGNSTKNRTDGHLKPFEFKPGQSGNPSGRPKIPDDVKQAFRGLTMDCVDVLAKIIHDDNAKNGDRIRATEIVLDRGWGKPAQVQDINIGNGGIVMIPTILDDNGK